MYFPLVDSTIQLIFLNEGSKELEKTSPSLLSNLKRSFIVSYSKGGHGPLWVARVIE